MSRHTQPTRVVVVDDHPLIRKFIREACDERPDLSVVGEAADGEAALELIQAAEPDVVVLDLLLRGGDGLDVMRGMTQRGLTARVLVVSGNTDPGSVYEAVRLGAAGFLEHSVNVEEVLGAIRDVAAGREVFSPELDRRAHLALSERARTARDGWVVRSHLTPREREILVLIVDGLTSRQVATRLHRSERTVETHTANLYRKLGVGTRVQAVRKAAALGLVDLAAGSRSATA
jgi:DNA-binding NarL/FixJ family response regulator